MYPRSHHLSHHHPRGGGRNSNNNTGPPAAANSSSSSNSSGGGAPGGSASNSNSVGRYRGGGTHHQYQHQGGARDHHQHVQQQQQQQQQHPYAAHRPPGSTVPVTDSARHDIMNNSNNKYDRFENWLRENGAEFELLELREYDCPTATATSSSTDLGTTAAAAVSSPSPSRFNRIKKAATGRAAAAGYAPDEEKKEAPGDSGFASDDAASAMSEMRGVHARRHIPPNTVCMSVPRQCLITVEMGQATPIGQAILQSDLDLDAPKHIFLMVFLLWDRKVNGVHSFFHPYYEILPPTLSNMPIFWNDDELDMLRGSYLLQQIADRNAAIQDDYNSICQIAPLEQICTLEEFKWARMCVCSRNFGLQMDGHRTSALVPHADMLNHFRPRETKWTFDEDRQAFTITSLQHISAGSQVYDSYGQKCNHRFLLNYGFAVEDNRELDGFCPNEVPIELYVDPDDELFQDKLDYWTRGESNSSSPTSGATYATTTSPWSGAATSTSNAAASYAAATPVVKRVRVCVSNNENTRLLFSLLRVLACNREELQSIASDVGRLGMCLASEMNVSRQVDPTYASSASTSSFLPLLPHSGGAYSYHTASAASSSSSSRSCRDIRHPISLRNERAALHLFLDVVQRHLNRYPTSLEQDERDLMDLRRFPRFSNARHAKIQVRGEKVVLHHFAEWARTGLHVLSVLQEELDAIKAGSDPSGRARRVDADEVEDSGVEVQLAHPGTSSPSTARNGTSLGRGHASAPSPSRHLIVLEPSPATASSPSRYASTASTTSPDPSSRPAISSARRYAAGDLGAATDKFERLIRQLEDASDANNNNNSSDDDQDDMHHHQEDEGIHHTIVRYCADVLGSLRREEMKLLKRRQAELAPASSSSASTLGYRHPRGGSGAGGSSMRPGAAYL